MWYRYFRCGIGIFPQRAFSDTTSEIISNRAGFMVILICTYVHIVIKEVSKKSFIHYFNTFIIHLLFNNKNYAL
jgi:hypothetical protein